MSGTGNCDDNAVVESFFDLLKRERVNRVRYKNRDQARDQARADLFSDRNSHSIFWHDRH
jgi:transposase InsO family protein